MQDPSLNRKPNKSQILSICKIKILYTQPKNIFDICIEFLCIIMYLLLKFKFNFISLIIVLLHRLDSQSIPFLNNLKNNFKNTSRSEIELRIWLIHRIAVFKPIR